MFITGIDPGVNGGIAVLDSSGKCVDIISMPEDLSDTVKFLRRYIVKNSVIVLEDVHSMPGQGVKSMFSFGKGFGELVGIITTLGLNRKIHFLLVSPRKWKSAIFGRIDKIDGETVIDRKKRLKQLSINKALELYPDVSLTPVKDNKNLAIYSDGMAEALLLAEYGRKFISL